MVKPIELKSSAFENSGEKIIASYMFHFSAEAQVSHEFYNLLRLRPTWLCSPVDAAGDLFTWLDLDRAF